MKIIIVNLFCLIAIGLQAQDLPTYMDAMAYKENEPAQIMFHENFKDNHNNWALGQSKYVFAGLDFNGLVYKSQIVKGEEGRWEYITLANLPIDMGQDYIILLDMEHKRSIGPTAYYFVWGESMSTRHAMGVDNGKLTYQFCDDNKFGSPAVNPGNMNYEGANWKFKIEKKKDSVYIYQSGFLYLKVPYKKFTAANKNIQPMSMIGFLLNGEVTIRCFDIRVLQNRAYGAKADSAYYLSYLAKANEDDANANFQLANMHWQGRGVDADKNKALQLYKKAAWMGHLKSMLNAGWAYEQKYRQSSMQMDKDSAIAYYKTAAIKNTGEPYEYFNPFMKMAYPYVELFDYRNYSMEKLPPSEKDYLEEKKRHQQLVARIQADAHFKLLPDYWVQLISIDRHNANACYISVSGKLKPLIKATPTTLQDKDFYYDEAGQQFFLYEKNTKLSKWALAQNNLYVVRGGCRSVNLMWEEKNCKACNGKGFTGGGMGSQTVYTPTGTYTTTRTQTIVGQTELVTVTPNYSTSTIKMYIPPVKCNACGGAGKLARQCVTVIKIQ